jgi:hypothetical protein
MCFDDPEGDPVWVAEAASAEIRAALTLTRRAADVELGFGVTASTTSIISSPSAPAAWHSSMAG